MNYTQNGSYTASERETDHIKTYLIVPESKQARIKMSNG